MFISECVRTLLTVHNICFDLISPPNYLRRDFRCIKIIAIVLENARYKILKISVLVGKIKILR